MASTFANQKLKIIVTTFFSAELIGLSRERFDDY